MASFPAWITQPSTNSRTITYPAAANLADFIDTIEAAILTMGWILFDVAAGANARAYRAFNKDGISYKYIVLDYDAAGYLMLKVYESWNELTHAGTNLAYGSDTTAYAQLVDLVAGGKMHIFAQASYMFLLSEVNGEIGNNQNGFTCICETMRDNPEDTVAAGYPPYIWTSAAGINAVSSAFMLAFCRTRLGNTGIQATIYAGFLTDFGQMGRYNLRGLDTGNYGIHGTTVPGSNHPWSGKVIASKMVAYFGQSTISWEIRGRVTGMILLGQYSNGVVFPFTDETIFKIDNDGFPNPAGIDSEHWILGNNGTVRVAIPK